MTTEHLTAPPRDAGGRGRPLDPDRDSAIHSAALELLAETGYDRVTMEAIAARARAGKATLYRRWSSKAELVADAVRCSKSDEPLLLDTGDVRSDLITGIHTLLSSMAKQKPLLSGVLTAMQTDPELATAIRATLVDHKHQASHDWVRRAIARGLLPPDADIDLFHEVVPGVVFMRTFMTCQPLDDAFVEHIVDDILLPLLLRGRAAGARPSSNEI